MTLVMQCYNHHMKTYKKTIALLLTACMMLTVSCGKITEETAAETAAVETEVTDTQVTETSASETTETSETSEETEASEYVRTFEGEPLDFDEYPFEITSDNFVSACEQNGASVYYDLDDFMVIYNSIAAANPDAVSYLSDGIAILSEDEAVADMLIAIGDPTAVNDEFNNSITKIGLFTAADPMDQSYQVVAMYYELDDPSLIAEWFDGAAQRFFDGVEDAVPDTENFTLVLNGYTNEEAGGVASAYLTNEELRQQHGYPDHTGAYFGFYMRGNNAFYITVTDFSEDARGLEIYDVFCDAMGIMRSES